MKSFRELLESHGWRPIPGCPGRWVLSPAEFGGPPREMAGGDAETVVYETERTADPVAVTLVEGGGLISYRKPDGKYVHTLGDVEGIRRKLEQLGLPTDGEGPRA